MDNFYNSVGLYELLHNRKTHIVGPLRTNRKDNPKSITPKKLKKPGEACWMRRGPVFVSKWKDKREILMLSTKLHHRMVNCTTSRGHNKLKPMCVHDYNTNMGGIDRSDHLLSYCSTPRKTIKWYNKVFFHLLDIAVMNSYVLFKKLSKQKKLRILKFRDALKGELASVDLGMEQPMKTSAPSTTLAEYETVDAFHSLENIPLLKENVPRYLRCTVCTQKKRETRYRCKDCEGTPPLCPAPRFAIYHEH